MCVQWAGNNLSLGVFDKGHYENSTIACVYLLSNVNGIFLRLTWLLAGKYALIGILCLFRSVRWYVGN